MGRSALDRRVSRAQDPRFTRVEQKLEDALDNDSVVETDGAVQGRFGARAKVDQAGYRAVGDGQGWLLEEYQILSFSCWYLRELWEYSIGTPTSFSFACLMSTSPLSSTGVALVE